MAKKTITHLEEDDSASNFGKQSLSENQTQGKDAKLLRDSNSPQEPDEDRVDPYLMDLDFCQVNDEAAEDADDELDSNDDDDCGGVWPLIVMETKTNDDQVALTTNHPKQDTQITTDTRHTHCVVTWENKVAQAGKDSAEISPTAQLASKHNLPRAPTPYPKPFIENRGAKLLYPLPTLRRHKGLENLRKNSSDSAANKIKMSSNTHLTPDQRGKMHEKGINEHVFSGVEQGHTVEIDDSNASSPGFDDQAPKAKTKARAVLGYMDDDDETNAKKSVTNTTTSAKVIHEKKSFRKLFQRKGTKDPRTPPSAGNTAGRRTISAPTLIDASPNAKELLNSASSIVNTSPSIKHVVNYSRPIMRHSSSDVSSGSPVMRSGSPTPLHASNSFTCPGTIPEGLTDSLNTDLIHDHSDLSLVHENEAIDEQTTIIDPLPDTAASDSDSFNPSDYSGDENSVQQAVAVPISFIGRAKLVDIRPSHGSTTRAPSHWSDMSTALTPGRTQLTDHDAEVLGAQDAARYYNNAMRSESRPVDLTTQDPFIDRPFQSLLAKPANEIAAAEMTSIKAQREEREILAIIKAKLAAKDAANGGRGAGIPRIDYGSPNVGTALRGNPPTNTGTATARGRFEGY